MPAIKTVGVFARKENEKAQKIVQKLLPWFEKQKIKTVLVKDTLNDSFDLIISLGGDGSLLRTVKLVDGAKIPVLSINVGKFGFLAEITPSNLEEQLFPVIKGNFKIEERLKLKAEIIRNDKIKATFHVLNDVVLHSGGIARISEYSVHINDQFLTTLKADGILVATPTGSTAYSLAAGGPVVDPKNEVMILTPICPHQLSNKPIVFTSDTLISIELLSLNNEVLLTADGQEQFKLEKKDVIKVQTSEQKAYFVKTKKDNYIEILGKKIFLSDLTKN